VEPRHEQAVRTCVNVKSRQKRSQDTAQEIIENLIEEQNLLKHKILAIRIDEDLVDKNLAGLIANQLASKYARPTLVLRICKDEDGSTIYAGSGRNYGRSRLEDFRDFCNRTTLVQYAQGHASAFGISIKEELFDSFMQVTDALLINFNFEPCYFVDIEVTEDELTDNEVFAIGSNADLWGQGLDEPLIAITNVRITKDNIQYLG
jgi:single-stranded-DNA-specific exonuclease